MIEINNLTSIFLNKEFIKRVGKEVLAGEKKKKNTNISVAFVSPAMIKKANSKYRNKNKITDVLAFPSFAKGYGGQARFLEKDSGLGEVIICPSAVKKNAKIFGLSFKKELSKVLIHGVLHLLGYNHESSKKKASEMEGKQNYYLSKIKA